MNISKIFKHDHRNNKFLKSLQGALILLVLLITNLATAPAANAATIKTPEWLVDIGPSPVNLGTTNKRVYWPKDENGKVMDRPANVVGMMPFSYSEFFKYPAAWLFVYVNNDGYDFKITKTIYKETPESIFRSLDDYLLLDDVKVYLKEDIYRTYSGKHHSILGGYAIKIKHGLHDGKWFAITYDGNGINEYETAHKGIDFYPKNVHTGRDTADIAIIASVDEHANDLKRILDGIDNAVKQAALNQKRDTYAIDHFRTRYQTTSVANCDRFQGYARDQGSQPAQDWQELIKTTGSIACNYIPISLASGFSQFMSGANVTTIGDAMSAYTRKVIDKGNVSKHWDCQNNPNGTATCRWVDR